MKKLYFLLIALPMLLFASCSDDKDFPEFKVKVDISGQTAVTDNGIIQVAQGQQLSIDAVTIAESSAKEITFGGATYYWNYIMQGTNIIPPYGMTFTTADLLPGKYLLQIYLPVYAVDYPVNEAVISYVVEIIEPTDAPQVQADVTTTLTSTPKLLHN